MSMRVERFCHFDGRAQAGAGGMVGAFSQRMTLREAENLPREAPVARAPGEQAKVSLPSLGPSRADAPYASDKQRNGAP